MSHETIERLTPEQAVALFDAQAQRFTSMSGDEFLRRHRARELDYSFGVARMRVLLPLVTGRGAA